MKTLEDMAAAVNEPKATPKPSEPAGDRVAKHLAGIERQRLEKRREIKAQIKQRDVLAQKMADLEAQILQLNARADGLAVEHRTAVAPIQTKLETATGEARTKLLEKLTAANLELETALGVVNRCREPLQQEHWQIRNVELGPLPTEQRLAGDDLANPSLLVEKFVIERRLASAQARCEAAADWVSRLDELVQQARTTQVVVDETGWAKVGGKRSLDFAGIHQLSHRLNRWKAESLDAEAEAAACLKEQAELLARMVAE